MRASTAVLSALSLSLSLFLCTAPASAASKAPDVHEVDREEIDKVRCDKTSELDVNYGDTLNFNASFTASDGAAVKVTNVKYWFWADQDYNASDPPITFTGTKEFMDGGIIKDKTIELTRTTDYVIRVKPSSPKKDNIIVKYDITYNEIKPDGNILPDDHLFVCARYRVLPEKSK